MSISGSNEETIRDTLGQESFDVVKDYVGKAGRKDRVINGIKLLENRELKIELATNSENYAEILENFGLDDLREFSNYMKNKEKMVAEERYGHYHNLPPVKIII